MLNQENMQIARDTVRIIDFGIGSKGQKGQYQNSMYTYIAEKDGIIHSGSGRFLAMCINVSLDEIRADIERVKPNLERTDGWLISRVDN